MTSAVSLLEVVVAYFVDERGLGRTPATNLILPVGGTSMVLFVGWVIYPRALAEVTNNAERPFAWAPLWAFVCRFVAPLGIAWILFSGL